MSDTTTTQTDSPTPTPPRKRRRWLVVLAGVAVAGLVGGIGLAAAGSIPGHPAATPPASTAPAAQAAASPAALTPEGAIVNAWWASTGHHNTDVVLHDALKITGDFRGTPDQLTVDAQQLYADAQTAQQDWNDAYVADGAGWTGPTASQIAQDFSATVGHYGSAGQGLAALLSSRSVSPDTAAGAYVSGAGVARDALARLNADLAALRLAPVVPPSIDSPNA
jgi:hypothetical protein